MAFEDTFTGTNGTLISARASDSGHNWTKISGDTDNRFEINGNRAMPAGAAGAEYRVNDYDFGSANQWVEVDHVELSDQNYYAEVGLRVDADGSNGYFLTFNDFSNVHDLVKKVGGTDTVLDSVAYVRTDVTFYFEVDGDSLRVLQGGSGGSEILSATDSDITGAGRLWIGKFGGPGSTDGTMFNAIRADALSAGGVAGQGPPYEFNWT
jgi:hypothetical protein